MSPKDVEPAPANIAVPDVGDGFAVLELEAIQDEAEAALVARGAAYARAYAQVEKAPTTLAMNLATVLLAIRRQHGDMRGETYEYRTVANEVYAQANIQDAEQLLRLKTNVRYHVGNIMRRALTPRELKRLNLLDTSPIERQQDKRATNAVLLKAVSASSEASSSTSKRTKTTEKGTEIVPAQAVKATADHLRLASVAADIVDKIDTRVIDDGMTAGQMAKLDEQLAAIERATRRLRRHLKNTRSES